MNADWILPPAILAAISQLVPLGLATESAPGLGIVSEILKAAPSAVSTVLVIVVVWAFLKHERARDKDFKEMLTSQRQDAVAALENNTDRMTTVLESMERNMERLNEGQTRILETIHSCIRRGD